MAEIRQELRQLRNLNRRGLITGLEAKYVKLFQEELTPLEREVMTQCYIAGRSYRSCGRKIGYCERQIYRIVARSIYRLENIKES